MSLRACLQRRAYEAIQFNYLDCRSRFRSFAMTIDVSRIISLYFIIYVCFMIKLLVTRKSGYTDKLQSAADAAAAVLGQKDAVSAAFGFVSAEKMRAVNLKFRGIDKATDVLSFPNLPLKKALSERAAIKAKDWRGETDGDGGVFLGDIIICRGMARGQSAEQLFIHGLLHLFGFDHAGDADGELMRKTEEKIYERYKRV